MQSIYSNLLLEKPRLRIAICNIKTNERGWLGLLGIVCHQDCDVLISQDVFLIRRWLLFQREKRKQEKKADERAKSSRAAQDFISRCWWSFPISFVSSLVVPRLCFLLSFLPSLALTISSAVRSLYRRDARWQILYFQFLFFYYFCIRPFTSGAGLPADALFSSDGVDFIYYEWASYVNARERTTSPSL